MYLSIIISICPDRRDVYLTSRWLFANISQANLSTPSFFAATTLLSHNIIIMHYIPIIWFSGLVSGDQQWVDGSIGGEECVVEPNIGLIMRKWKERNVSSTLTLYLLAMLYCYTYATWGWLLKCSSILADRPVQSAQPTKSSQSHGWVNEWSRGSGEREKAHRPESYIIT